MNTKIERALISVSNKEGVASFARLLQQRGVELLATGGTYRLLCDEGLKVREVSEVTEFPEMMDGRVKTLHPRIHGGILARRDEAGDVESMDQHGIPRIDLVVVNLYPFEQTVAKEGVSWADAIENIDIGGPTMVRSAAKNHAHVLIVTDPGDYGRVLDELEKGSGEVGPELRSEMARKAFALTARYDAAVSGWMLEQSLRRGESDSFPESFSVGGTKTLELRYGENPHQKAAFYSTRHAAEPSVASAEFLGGKELSYNNLVDLDAALGLAKEFERPFVCVVKHNNPCGAACADELSQAMADAWAGDPLSAFGSVLAFNRTVDAPTAEFLISERRFVEAIIAPGFETAALSLLRDKPKWGKNVRLLAAGPIRPADRDAVSPEIKVLRGGFLLQGRDLASASPDDLEVVTQAEPSPEEVRALIFADQVGKHVKSNAIVLATGERVLGVGAGQMSRVDSVQLAVAKAGDEAEGSVLASDAFFPFPDGVEAAMDAGVRAILQPGGSMRDSAVIDACNERGVPMVFTRTRHFRH